MIVLESSEMRAPVIQFLLPWSLRHESSTVQIGRLDRDVDRLVESSRSKGGVLRFSVRGADSVLVIYG